MWQQTRISIKGEFMMKKYSELEIEIRVFELLDVIRTSDNSAPEGDNNLPWVDVTIVE